MLFDNVGQFASSISSRRVTFRSLHFRPYQVQFEKIIRAVTHDIPCDLKKWMRRFGYVYLVRDEQTGEQYSRCTSAAPRVTKQSRRRTIRKNILRRMATTSTV